MREPKTDLVNMTRLEREEAIEYFRSLAEVEKQVSGSTWALAKIRYFTAGADALEASLHGLLLTEAQLKEAILSDETVEAVNAKIRSDSPAVVVEDLDGELSLADRTIEASRERKRAFGAQLLAEGRFPRYKVGEEPKV